MTKRAGRHHDALRPRVAHGICPDVCASRIGLPPSCGFCRKDQDTPFQQLPPIGDIRLLDCSLSSHSHQP